MARLKGAQFYSLLVFPNLLIGSQVASSCLLYGSQQGHQALSTASKVGAGALLAFAMELSEYLVVVNTSSLTLSVAGVFKVFNFTVSKQEKKTIVLLLHLTHFF